jgi:hypothetical protein
MHLERIFAQPQDVEWVVDPAGRPYILQSRPIPSCQQPMDPLQQPLGLACNDEALFSPKG